MYDVSTEKAASFADSLRSAFEDALDERIRALESHADLVEYAVRSGHRTRPVGCLLSCAAVGGEWSKALHAAVAVELIHKSSVIRDDVVDGDSVRSGQPAFHVRFDVPRAIAASDLLWTLGLREFAALAPGSAGEACMQASALALHEMAAGQLEDVAPSRHLGSVKARRLVEERKTGVLSELACRLGALIGGGSATEVDALARYGRELGTAFQILNDVRNLRGEEPERGPASDLRKRRDTVLSAHARAIASTDVLALRAPRAGGDDLPDAQVLDLRQRLIASGAGEFGESLATELMANARSRLEALPPSPAGGILASLAEDGLLTYAF